MRRFEPFRGTAARLLLALLLGLALTPAAVAATPSAVVLAVSGGVQAVRDGAHRTLKLRSPLFSGDTIVTGKGQVQVRFRDGTLFSLYAHTSFAIDDYSYKRPGRGDLAHFSLLKGLIHSLTGQIDKRSYRVRTRLADLGVRGTDYTAQLGQHLAVNVQHGAVVVTNQAGSLLVRAGNSALVGAADAFPVLRSKHAGGGAGRPGGGPHGPPPGGAVAGPPPAGAPPGGASDGGAPPPPAPPPPPPANTVLPNTLAP